MPPSSAPPLVIRPRRPSDDAFIASLSAEAFRPYSRDGAGAVRGMVRSPHSRTLVATFDEVPVGIAVFELRSSRRKLAPIEQVAVAHLDAIAVVPGMRGQGIGSALLSRALKSARRAGAASMSLMTAERNRCARDVFERAGFAVMAWLDSVYEKRERALVMHRPLV